jgi:hypothetical protein
LSSGFLPWGKGRRQKAERGWPVWGWFSEGLILVPLSGAFAGLSLRDNAIAGLSTLR